ncbi:MAG TPA: asparaginase [Candidatus Eisenbacteria bacterium]|nr:asparaginase [Candidatus Eisenbacteria bacterium]
MAVTQRQARGVDLAAADARATPLVHVLRDERVESIHRGHVAVVDARGRLLAFTGEPKALVFPRSAFKPFQALPLVESGAFAKSGLASDALALIAGSHSGTDRHAALARTILRAAGVDESMLQCGVHPPYDEATAERLRRAHEEPTPVRHNCSGKHAGMMLFARYLGAPVETYADPSHPVQQHIFDRFASLLGEPWTDPEPAIDGCSAPTPRMPLDTLARAFALLASGQDSGGAPLPALAAIRDAMQEHPELVAGPGRLDALLMRATPSAVAKAGAEAVHAIGLVDIGVGIAVKVEDGSRRALGPAVVSVLEALGVLGDAERRALAQHAGEPLRNAAGLEVGSIRGVARLEGGGLR